MPAACPHCGQPISRAPVDLVDALRVARLNRKQRIVAETLTDAWPRVVPLDIFYELFWPNAADEPATSKTSITNSISQLRAIVRPSGFTICRSAGGAYQFEART